jgi:hypothetical protein
VVLAAGAAAVVRALFGLLAVTIESGQRHTYAKVLNAAAVALPKLPEPTRQRAADRLSRTLPTTADQSRRAEMCAALRTLVAALPDTGRPNAAAGGEQPLDNRSTPHSGD